MQTNRINDLTQNAERRDERTSGNGGAVAAGTTATDRRIVNTSREGNFVLESQPLATKEGFRNVAKQWYDTTRPIEEELDALENTRDMKANVPIEFGQISPGIENRRFCLKHEDGRDFFPDDYSARQIGSLVGVPGVYAGKLAGGDEESRELLVFNLEHHWHRILDRSRFIFKVEQKDERCLLRGILAASKAMIPNEWYLRVVEQAIPGGRLSHWRGDLFTIYGHVLIPDSLRAEEDSEYGAMVTLSNCELGKRSLTQWPALIRAICMNGCRWGVEHGEQFTLKRRGPLDMNELRRELLDNIRAQIPLAMAGIDQLLNTRRLKTDVSMKAVIADACREFKVSRDLSSAVLWGYAEERRATPELTGTLFGVINAFTRAGQAQPNETWMKFEEIGGRLAGLDQDGWQARVSRAAKLPADTVERTFAKFMADSMSVLAN